MTTLHAYFALKNQQAFQRLLNADANASVPISGGRLNERSGGAALSSSGGRSWNKPSPLTSATSTIACDVNAKDWLGRTVLHLAASSLEPSALEYVKLLLSHPKIDVNLADTESRWTALHRALYTGNLPACLLLLQRSDVDTSLKDFEGYTAFDLYNSTIEGTKPEFAGKADLLTWGANRNATLGQGDSDDRAYPDHLTIPPQHTYTDADAVRQPLSERFLPIRVKQVAMSRLHTVIVTDEQKGNVRVCGFGSGGRLGHTPHTQYNLIPLPSLANYTITSVALGQDHTLALTSSGDVLSWGLGRFGQLGYVVENANVGTSGTAIGGATFSGAGTGLGATVVCTNPESEPIQSTPRRIFGPLKKEVVKGVTACKTASACWTDVDLFTWGTNTGQLGYDSSAQPVQILPRKVTGVTQPVVDVALSGSAMVCLLQSRDVICFHKDRHTKINFPSISFPSEIQAYKPPMNTMGIVKVVCCDGVFAALSVSGEMFVFSVGGGVASDGANSKVSVTSTGISAGTNVIRPQRVWALRKQFSAVKDVALGSDGAIILCTDSGHVYIRSRNAKSGPPAVQMGSSSSSIPTTASNTKAFKFRRVPYVQRVSRVSANSTGAFGALRVEWRPERIEVGVEGELLREELKEVRPYVAALVELASNGTDVLSGDGVSPMERGEDGEDEHEDGSLRGDIMSATTMCALITRDVRLRGEREEGVFDDGKPFSNGADILVHVRGENGMTFAFPAHKLILAARSTVLERVLRGARTQTVKERKISISYEQRTSERQERIGLVYSSKTAPSLVFSGCHPLSVLIFVDYLYSDEVVAIWDRRVGLAVETQIRSLHTNVAQIRSELQVFARICDLPHLRDALDAHVKRTVFRSLTADFASLYKTAQIRYGQGTIVSDPSSPLAPDTILELADQMVFCHSVILRARSPFFAGLFGDEEWTVRRWRPDRTVVVDLKHMKWREMEFVLRYVYCDDGDRMFDVLEFVQSVDDVLQFMYDVMAIASELLLDRLMLVCSTVILKFVTINNVCSVLTDAAYYHSDVLVERLEHYMACNMETLLESHMLEDLQFSLVKRLATYVRSLQSIKQPYTRSNELVDKAMEKHADWLALQDFPTPIVRSEAKRNAPGQVKMSPPAQPSSPGKRSRKRSGGLSLPSPLSTPVLAPMTPVRLPALPGTTAVAGEDIFEMDFGEPVIPVKHVPGVSSTASTPAVPWRSSVATSATRVDFRAVMAEAEGNKQSVEVNIGVPRSGTVGTMTTPPGLERKKSQVQFAASSSSVNPSTPPRPPLSTLPWRNAQLSVGTPPSPPQARTRLDSDAKVNPLSGPGQAGKAKDRTNPVQAVVSPTNPLKTKQTMGPTFTPTKQVPSSSTSTPTVRRVSDGPGKAWGPSHPPAIAPRAPPSASPPSFLSIQQQQRDQGKVPAQPKKSLREIQEEEQAKQAEEEFLRWWAEEEERIRLETMVASIPDVAPVGDGQKKKKPRKKPPFKGNQSANANKQTTNTKDRTGDRNIPGRSNRKSKDTKQM